MMSQRWVVFQLFAELLCSAKLILEIEMEHNLQLTKEKREDIRYVICADVLDLDIFVREDCLPLSKQT